MERPLLLGGASVLCRSARGPAGSFSRRAGSVIPNPQGLCTPEHQTTSSPLRKEWETQHLPELPEEPGDEAAEPLGHAHC